MRQILALFFIFHVMSLKLYSDTIKMKDGKVIDGRILSESESDVIIKTQSGIQEISKRKISNIKIGYTTVSACYALLKEPASNFCSKQLFKFSLDKLKFVSKNLSDPPEVIKLSDVKELEIHKDLGEEIIPFLPENVQFEISLKNRKISGRIISKTDTSIKLQSGAALYTEISEEEIVAVTYRQNVVTEELLLSTIHVDPRKRNSNTNRNYYHYLLPGTGQYENGELKKSMIFFSTTFLLTAGVWSQYSAAKESSNKHDYLLIPNENGFYVLNDFTKSKNQFDAHQRNYYLLASGLIFTFILNALDLKSTMNENQKLGFDIYFGPDSGNRMTGAVQFQYSLRF